MNYQIIIFIGLFLVFVAEISLALINYRQIGKISIPEELISAFKEDELKKNYAYNLDKAKFSFTELTISFVLSILVLFSGILSYFTFSSDWFGIINYLVLGIILSIITLPLSIYSQFIIEQKHGFNNMDYKLFLKDFMQSTLLKIILTFPLIYLCLFVVENVQSWWIWVSLIFIVFQLVILFLYPLIIAPLFNKFELLKDKTVADEIITACNAIDYSLASVYQMDGSKRSNRGNAYFTGFGKSKRVVFFDTLLNLLNVSEIKAVLYHEIGHKKCNHIIKTFFLMSLVVLSGTWFMNYLYVSSDLFNQFKLEKTFISLLVIFEFGFSFLGFILGILFSIFSRKNEFEADAFAKNIDGGSNLIAALIKLMSNNKSNLTPHPLYSFVYYSHPTVAERIRRLS